MSNRLPINVQKSRLMSRDEVRGVDAWAINELGIAGVVLMENAGRGCAEIVLNRFAGSCKKACILCGGGNNGGDGYVVARHLFNAGVDVKVILCGDRQKIKGDALANLEIIEKLNIDIVPLDVKSPEAASQVKELADDSGVIVDAIFGTGLSGMLKDEYITLINAVNVLGKNVISVDIPSGLDCDTGRPLGTAIKAIATATFVAVKKGFAAERAHEYTGDVYVVSIGIEK